MCGTEQVLFAQLQLLVTSWQADRQEGAAAREEGAVGGERKALRDASLQCWLRFARRRMQTNKQ